jgi:hypothetical protein
LNLAIVDPKDRRERHREARAWGNVYTLGDVRLTLEGLPVRSDGIFALDMTSTNQRLMMKGVDPIRAVIGQDVLRYHQTVIDYAALALFLKEEPD